MWRCTRCSTANDWRSRRQSSVWYFRQKTIYWHSYEQWMSIDPEWLAANERRFAERFGAEGRRFIRVDRDDGIQYFKIGEFNNEY